MPERIAKQGDCIAKLSDQHGFFWETVWNHPANSSLKAKRGNPNVLIAGDRVFIPKKQLKEVPKATDARHRFKRKGIPSKIRLRLLIHGRPRADMPYTITVDGLTSSDWTDGDGWLSLTVLPGAQCATLRVIEGDTQDQYQINLGHLDPISKISGVQQRLANLGLTCDVTGVFDEQTRAAIEEFQQKSDLTATGDMDEQTRDLLGKVHGC